MNTSEVTPSGRDGASARLRRMRRLVSAACDAPLAEAEADELAALLETHRELVPEYVEFVATEAALAEQCGVSFFEPPPSHRDESPLNGPQLGGPQLGGPRVDRPRVEGPPARAASRVSNPRATPRPLKPDASAEWRRVADWSRRWGPALAVSATLLLCVGLAASWWGARLGSVVATRGAVWGTTPLHVGDTVGPAWQELRAGSADVALRSGAMVSVKGPARFRFVGKNRCELRRGLLTARVGESAQGFRVDAPLARAIDLGTGFRMLVDAAGQTTLRVTEGAVRFETDAGRLLLDAGEIGVADSDGLRRANPPKPAVSGGAKLHSTSPESLGFRLFSRDDELSVFLEAYRVALPHEVELNVARPGRHGTLNGRQGVAAAGRVVDCYLVHSAPRKRRHLASGTIRFDRAIVGVLCDGDRLSATDAVFGAPWSLRCEHPERGCESTPDRYSDLETIGADRRTLSLAMRTESIDQLRVLVAAD